MLFYNYSSSTITVYFIKVINIKFNYNLSLQTKITTITLANALSWWSLPTTLKYIAAGNTTHTSTPTVAPSRPNTSSTVGNSSPTPRDIPTMPRVSDRNADGGIAELCVFVYAFVCSWTGCAWNSWLFSLVLRLEEYQLLRIKFEPITVAWRHWHWLLHNSIFIKTSALGFWPDIAG